MGVLTLMSVKLVSTTAQVDFLTKFSFNFYQAHSTCTNFDGAFRCTAKLDSNQVTGTACHILSFLENEAEDKLSFLGHLSYKLLTVQRVTTLTSAFQIRAK